MSISYTLRKNHLGTTDGYFATFASKGTITLDELATILVAGGSTTAKSDILAVFEDVGRLSGDFLNLGNRVEITGLCSFYPRFQGNFPELDTPYDSAIHKKGVGATPSTRIKRSIKESLVEQVSPGYNEPRILRYTDVKTGVKDTQFTLGNMGVIKGEHLAFDNAAPDEGIFLIDSVDDSETIKIETVQKNSPSELVFMIQSSAVLTSGEGFITVRSRVGKPNGLLLNYKFPYQLTAV